MRPQRLRAVAVLFALWHCDCVSPRNEGGECVFNSDCEEPLLCSARRCRAQCRDTRDCPESTRCSSSTQPLKNVCVPSSEPWQCALQSDCPQGSRCERNQCRAECREDRDCVLAGSGARCDAASQRCIEPLLVERADATAATDATMDSALDDASGDVACSGLCATNEQCVDGGCAPRNDRCADAINVPLTAGTVHVVSGSTSNARDSSPSCTNDSDVYYAINVSEPGVLVVDSFGNTVPVRVGLQLGGCGAATTTCSLPICEARAEFIAMPVEPGRHTLAIDTGTPRNFVFRLAFFPSNATTISLVPRETMFTHQQTLSATPTRVDPSCGTGGERLFLLYTCPNEITPRLHVDSCASPTIATRLAVQSAERSVMRCASGGCDGGLGAAIDLTLPSSTLLFTMVSVAGESPSAIGPISVTTRHSTMP